MANLVCNYIARDVWLIHRWNVCPANAHNPLRRRVERTRKRYEPRVTEENREISGRLAENLRNVHRSATPFDYRLA
jgi:hypothetical protein